MDDQQDKLITRIPTLTRENHEAWFRRMKIKLKGKGIFYTIEQTAETYAWIADPKAKGIATPPSNTTPHDATKKNSIDKLVEDFARWGGSWNIEKKEAYNKAESNALDIMLQSLNEEDQALIDEYETALGLWTALQVKYSKTNESTANIYMGKITQFTFDKKAGLDSSWAKLKEYRRKLIAAKGVMKSAYPDEALFLILTKKLPSIYKATTDGFRLQKDMLVEDKLRILYEVEEDNKEAEEQAHLAQTSRRGKYIPPQRRRQQSYDSSASDCSERDTQCFLCKGDHVISRCPNINRAARLLKEYKKTKAKAKQESRAKDSCTKDSKPSKALKKSSDKKSRAYAAESLSDDSDDSSAQAFSPTTDDEDEPEQCCLSKEELSKATSSIWPADTGATSHMSDQRSLFTFLKPIKPKRVKVGGGELKAEYMGDAELVCMDGSSMVLADALYVPNIGVNLLSIRRLCQAGMRFSGNQDKLYLKHKKNKIVTAKMINGLYIVTHIADGYREKAFQSMELDEATPAAITAKPAEDSSDDEAVKKSDLERYLKYHQRFAHLGPDKIRNLHKVTTLKRRVKVPRNLDVCDVCAITKMKNKIPKELSPSSKEILGQIQFDVAGPFPASIRGNQWFLLIIDICTRRDWVLPLKHKGDAYGALKAWKVEVERQAEKKIKRARSDNAPELLKAIDNWRVEDGVQAQSTTIASSHQNGPA